MFDDEEKIRQIEAEIEWLKRTPLHVPDMIRNASSWHNGAHVCGEASKQEYRRLRIVRRLEAIRDRLRCNTPRLTLHKEAGKAAEIAWERSLEGR